MHVHYGRVAQSEFRMRDYAGSSMQRVRLVIEYRFSAQYFKKIKNKRTNSDYNINMGKSHQILSKLMWRDWHRQSWIYLPVVIDKF